MAHLNDSLYIGEAIAMVMTAIQPYAFGLVEPTKGHFDIAIKN